MKPCINCGKDRGVKYELATNPTNSSRCKLCKNKHIRIKAKTKMCSKCTVKGCNMNCTKD